MSHHHLFDPDPPDARADSEAESVRLQRIACAEVNARRVNESIERGKHSPGDLTVICECGRLGCTALLSLAVADYERVRSTFERFIVAPGHDTPNAELVVERHPGFCVVAKTGELAGIAERTDPRSGDDDDT